jgi:hypothetical protein
VCGVDCSESCTCSYLLKRFQVSFVAPFSPIFWGGKHTSRIYKLMKSFLMPWYKLHEPYLIGLLDFTCTFN